MSYPELREPCKSCLGCMRLENPNFISDPNCRWREKRRRVNQCINYTDKVNQKDGR